MDKRTDVWAFGCVLYEMLTGRRAFDGEDVTDVIAAVVRGEPDSKALPADLPDEIRILIKRCLDKDRRTRVSDVAVARFLMTETVEFSRLLPGEPAPAVPRLSRATIAGVALGVVTIVFVTAVATAVLSRPAPTDPPEPVRFALVPPASLSLALSTADRDIALSPDGTFVVYRGGPDNGSEPPRLMVRRLNELDARPLADTDGPRFPFVSPDARWIGFFTATELKRVAVAGGPSMPVAVLGAGSPRGASWIPDETIVLATSDGATGLLRVPAGGGEPTVLTKPNTTQGEADHYFPWVLPGGRAVLFTIGSPGASSTDNSRIAVLDLASGQYKTLIQAGSHPEYVDAGYLVYAAAGSLRAVRFDAERLEVLSDPIPVVDQVDTRFGAAQFSVSKGGSLVFVRGTPGGDSPPRRLVWVNRQGREEAINAPPRTYAVARISQDGTRAALDIRDRGSDIWVWDFRRQTLTPLTFTPVPDTSPVWMSDNRIAWAASTPDLANPKLYWQAADGTGTPELLTTGPHPQFPTSTDGTRLFLFENVPGSAQDVMSIGLPGPGASAPGRPQQSTPILQTPASELGPEISPDGKWLAYTSNRSKRAKSTFPHFRAWTADSGRSRPPGARGQPGRAMAGRSSTSTATGF